MTDNEIYMFNLNILNQMAAIDAQSIPFLRQNNTTELANLEAQYQALKAQLITEG